MDSKDIECPYCGYEQEINHDDGYGYEEGEFHNQQCLDCDKYFTYTTSIHYFYDAVKSDCLNDGEHAFKPTFTYPAEFTMMQCTQCGERRKPTEDEMTAILAIKKGQP